MHIICSTTSAAAQVLSILFSTRLKVRQDFQISPVLSVALPIVFTIDPLLLDGLLAQIGALADTIIQSVTV